MDTYDKKHGQNRQSAKYDGTANGAHEAIGQEKKRMDLKQGVG